MLYHQRLFPCSVDLCHTIRYVGCPAKYAILEVKLPAAKGVDGMTVTACGGDVHLRCDSFSLPVRFLRPPKAIYKYLKYMFVLQHVLQHTDACKTQPKGYLIRIRLTAMRSIK
jgi:hypothetical protein